MTATGTRAGAPVRLGPRAKAAQSTLLVTVNALLGGMLGQELTVLPLLVDQTFHVGAYAGRSDLHPRVRPGQQAGTNHVAGTWSQRYGRKPVHVAGQRCETPSAPARGGCD